jgi:hypothetical protein
MTKLNKENVNSTRQYIEYDQTALLHSGLYCSKTIIIQNTVYNYL